MTHIAIVGLGNLGMPVAKEFDRIGLKVTTFSKSPHTTNWLHNTDERSFLDYSGNFSTVLLAAGISKPSLIERETDYKLSLDIASRIAEKSNNTRFFYFSTGAVYGECEYHKNEADIVNPSTPYGNLKLDIERRLYSLLGERVTQLRIGNIFGQSQRSGLISSLKSSVEKMQKPEIYASLDSCRDYMYEQYFVGALNAIINSTTVYPIINIGSGTSLSLYEILEIFQLKNEIHLRTSMGKSNSGDLLSTKLDTSLLNTIFKPHPELKVAMRNYLRTP